MIDILVFAVLGIGLYAFYKIMMKEPILPWKEKKVTNPTSKKSSKKKGRKHEVSLEEEPQLFEELFTEMKDISNHMVQFHDNTFTMIAEVDPVNYFLKSQDEQEAIDTVFESWLAQLNYPVRIYLQSRYIDITEPIQQMDKAMRDSEDLNEAALSFGQGMINDLIQWQSQTPRFETKRYLIFTHKIKPNDISADTKEELEEKIVDKAFSELLRRVNTAKSQLRKAEMEISLLPTEGIYELLYHTFNRRKAVKQRFKDMIEHEKNAMYVTADQTDERIEAVKETIEENEKEQAETSKSEAV